jgi:hypothetical protein
MTDRRTADNKGFAIAGVQCFVDTLVVNQSVVLRRNSSAKTPRHRKPPKRLCRVRCCHLTLCDTSIQTI